mmetsp:Transcript_20360/g.65108  ORF Transcript_20360/g.65108 Transcript_20360/m.65108 type:complete len:465 (-) Transcript_20360:586-1980(-)
MLASSAIWSTRGRSPYGPPCASCCRADTDSNTDTGHELQQPSPRTMVAGSADGSAPASLPASPAADLGWTPVSAPARPLSASMKRPWPARLPSLTSSRAVGGAPPPAGWSVSSAASSAAGSVSGMPCAGHMRQHGDRVSSFADVAPVTALRALPATFSTPATRPANRRPPSASTCSSAAGAGSRGAGDRRSSPLDTRSSTENCASAWATPAEGVGGASAGVLLLLLVVVGVVRTRLSQAPALLRPGLRQSATATPPRAARAIRRQSRVPATADAVLFFARALRGEPRPVQRRRGARLGQPAAAALAGVAIRVVVIAAAAAVVVVAGVALAVQAWPAEGCGQQAARTATAAPAAATATSTAASTTRTTGRCWMRRRIDPWLQLRPNARRRRSRAAPVPVRPLELACRRRRQRRGCARRLAPAADPRGGQRAPVASAARASCGRVGWQRRVAGGHRCGRHHQRRAR